MLLSAPETERSAVNAPSSSDALTGRTIWAGSIAARLGSYLRTESGSSGVLLAAIVAALAWANLSPGSYDLVWGLKFTVRIGTFGLDMDLREWVGAGLMTLFFLVVGLEARREIDLGDLRDRRQFVIPFCAGIIGMAIPVGIYLAVTAGHPGGTGWGVAMSTDTALSLGLLSLVGRDLPDRIRGFIVTLFIVDDVVALIVIVVAYSSNIEWVPLVVAILLFALIPLMLRWRRAPSAFYAIAGVASWAAMLFSGVDPLVVGLAIGLVAPAYSPGRDNLEQATGLVKRFREQPTSQLARTASAGLIGTISPNERLETLYHPWTSYFIVPVFALANAGIQVDGPFLARAYVAPITIGVIVAYVVGKPVAVFGTSALITKLSGGRLRPPVGWAAVAGSGTIAGVGFTVAVLIAGLAFHGEQLADAKVGILSAAIASSIITWLVFRITALLPEARRARALLGDTEQLVDLSSAVDAARDHIRGPADAAVTVVEYGDFQCPYCGRAESAVSALLEEVPVRFVWRHLPLTGVHPQAQLAAEASEAAATQGKFWAMHDLLLTNQDHLRTEDLVGYAGRLGLDVELFEADLGSRVHQSRVDEDVATADLSDVAGTPTFFINGQRHYGAYDVASLRDAVRAAGDRVRATASR